ncbi:MAG TPA: hypothetical protein VHY35_18260 [Stellaceae bacterium]|nr:hypothetical protein [Stellaceae bacterium]
MRYTKLALLVFGLGLISGFIAVVGEIPRLELPSSAVMALGLVLIPVGLFADGHGFVMLRWIADRLSRHKRPKPRARARSPAKPRSPTRPRGRPAAPKSVKPAAKSATPRRAAKPRPRTARTPRSPSR